MVQERLDNGSPSITITFPDGYSDLLVLNHFYDKENRPEGCHFMGHLENEPDSCIGTNNWLLPILFSQKFSNNEKWNDQIIKMQLIQ